ncbi:MAG TPA: sigma-70 family RNA polymerase sigma factor [Wenzhouxiangellaceae bacterium]|nr:sigma-70 family RNA polymerase sigma factor [Wenzhouxiangellaceae bacterium]
MHPLWPKIEAFHPQLWRAVSGYELNPALREELYQEVLLAIWESLPRLREPDRLLFFALRIAHNLGASHARTAARRPAAVSFDERSHDMGAGDRPGDREAARRNWLFDALAALPLNLRQVLMLQLEGFDYGEIAELLGISADNVGVRLHRARKRLRQLSREDQSDGD